VNGQPKRVVAVTQDDPFFTGRFFASFLPECARLGVEVVEIVVLPNFDESRLALVRRLVGFCGLAGFLRLSASYGKALVSDRRGSPRSVAALAERNDVPVRRLDTINDSGYLTTVSERDVDILLSVSAPQIFLAEALAAAPLALNVHSGKLPRYRGMMPTFWALANGDDRVTVTVHEMVRRLDAGPIVREVELPVEQEDTVFAIAARAKVVAGREVARLLAEVDPESRASWRVPEVPTDPPFRFPTRRDVRRLRAHGHGLL
jgi:methionyl-tRNA formyltransferase